MSRHPGRMWAVVAPRGRSHGQLGRCPTGKVSYRNRVAAIAGRSRVITDLRRNHTPVKPISVYRCRAVEGCRARHLTSQEQRT